MAAQLGDPLIASLVEEVYDCVPDAGRWQELLANATQQFNGVMALVAVADTASGAIRFTRVHGDEAVLAPLTKSGISGLPFYGAIADLEVDCPVTIDMLYDRLGPGARQSWLASSVNRDLAVPNRFDDFYWVNVLKQAGRIGNFVIVTSLDHPVIAEDEFGAFTRFAPHVRRAVTIGDLFEEERRRAERFEAALDALLHPVFIVASDLRLLWHNQSAEQLCRDSGTISTSKGRLAFSWQPVDVAVQRIVALGMQDESALGTAGINLPLSARGLPLVAHVLPLARRDTATRIAGQAAAAIFVAEHGSFSPSAMEAVAALFGLTAAEKRIAGQVAEGLTRQEIAEANAVSDGTVKSQLASVFDKTNTSDQRQLGNLVRTLTPPVGPRGHPPRGR